MIFPVETYAEAKELLHFLSSKEKCKRLHSKHLRSFNALSIEFNSDISESAAESYESKLQEFIKEVHASSLEEVDAHEPNSSTQSNPSVVAPPAEQESLTDDAIEVVAEEEDIIDAGLEASDELISQYESDLGCSFGDDGAAIVNGGAGDTGAYEPDQLAPSLNNNGIDAGDEGDESGEEEDETPAPKKKRRKKGSNLCSKKKGRKGKAYQAVKDDDRKRKKPHRAARASKSNAKKAIADQISKFDISKAPEADVRRLISLFYLNVLGAPPPDDDAWIGRKGVVSQIYDAMKFDKRTSGR